MRNYIFAGKVNFEGSLNDCRGIEGEGEREGATEREGGKVGRRKIEKGGKRDCDAPTRSVGRHGGEGARERCREGGSY